MPRASIPSCWRRRSACCSSGWRYGTRALRHPRSARCSWSRTSFFSSPMAWSSCSLTSSPGLFLLLNARSLRWLATPALPYVGAGMLVLAYGLARLRFESVPAGDPASFSWGLGVLRLSFSYLWAAWATDDPRKPLFVLLFVAMLAAPLVLRSSVGRPEALVPFMVTLLVWICVPLRAAGTGMLYLRATHVRAALLCADVSSIAGDAEPLPAPVAAHDMLDIPCGARRSVPGLCRESAPFETVLAAAEPGQRALSVVFDWPAPAPATSSPTYTGPPGSRLSVAASSISTLPASCRRLSAIGAIECRRASAERNGRKIGRRLRLGARWRRGLPLLLRPACRAVGDDVLSGGPMSAGAGHVGRRLVAL